MQFTRLFLIAIILGYSATALAEWQWGISWGSMGMDRVWDLATDSNDNIYACGDFTDSLCISNIQHQGMGLLDSYLVKLDAQGNLQWAVSYGSDQEDTALSVDTDPNDNVYVCGYFLGDLTIEDLSVSSQGMWDAYCAKFSPDGETIWLKTWGGSLNDIAYGLCCANNGVVYLSGWFADSFTLDNDITLQSYGGSDVFCAALSASGDFLWAHNGGTIGVEYGYDVACDFDSNLYVLGVASSGSNFDDLVLDSSGVFVAKYNPAGQIQWLSPTQASSVLKIGVDKYSNSAEGIIAGRVVGTGSFGTFQYDTVGGSSDAYWASFSLATGNWTALNLYGSFGDDRARACEYRDFPAMTGSYEQSVSFGNHQATSNGLMDAFLLRDSMANPDCASAGGLLDESPAAICILSNGSVIIGGWHFGQFRLGNHLLGTGADSDQNSFLACSSFVADANDPQQSPQIPWITAYPNPFTHSVNLKLYTPDLNLAIYNIRGQEIRRLDIADGGEAVWDGLDSQASEVPAGLYLVKALDKNKFFKVLKLR